ncbi:hypothetical protein PINS_up009644 [Pythium insidiosum]|nr:hypothetical protein PINS_up009644 [Pythium insidiosum]
MIMADQDHDGSHIKGLVINFIHHFWPSLLKIEGFLQEFITPIVKCTKGKSTKVFYTIPEYEHWREENNNGRGWKIKYHKGLGTSKSEDAKAYFSDLRTHQIGFVYEGQADGDSIDMAFSKKRVEERKDWLRGYEPGTHVDYNVDEMPYTDFVNKELILFSMADNIRSIPSVVDGFKPSQRKVLFCCFKRNLKNEIKVAQLGGYVSEHSAYHHGEQSLNGTIINMAQDFVGSNNIHLLSPNGQFGTRLAGGKDAASPRYIFTNLEQLTRRIFDPLDNDNLTYLDDDGQSIEPEWYVPIIPMALVNGGEGIGTGWSSSIPNYNPLDLIRNLRHKIRGEELEPLVPWYRGFTGTITEKVTGKSTDTFIVQGTYEIPDDSTIVISELPVKSWTTPYKQFLETLIESDTIKDFKEGHTDTTVLFTISLEPNKLREIVNAPGGVVKKFKLETSISTSNMHLFDATGRIKKYETPLEILEEFYHIRLEFYHKRKVSMMAKLAEQVKVLSNKARFILAVVSGQMVVSNRKKDDLLRQLVDDGYDQFLPSSSKRSQTPSPDESDTESEESTPTSKGYDYLLSMKIWSLTREQLEKLKAELQQRQQEYSELEMTPEHELWLRDLDQLEELIHETERQRERVANSVPTLTSSSRRPAARRPKKKANDSDSDYEMTEKPKAKPKARATKSAPVKTESGTKKESASKSISSFFKPTAAKEEPKIEEKKDDIEVLSLAERLARRVQVTPKKEQKTQSESRRQRKPISLVNLASSDDEASGNDDAESDDDVFALSVGKQSKTSASKAGSNRTVVSKAVTDVSSPQKAKGALKRRKEKTPQKARRPGATLLDDPAPQSSPLPKKQRTSTINLDDDEDEDDTSEATTAVPARRGGRARQRIVYNDLMSDDEDEETPRKPPKSRKAAKSKDDDDESEFSDAAFDDDSD